MTSLSDSATLASREPRELIPPDSPLAPYISGTERGTERGSAKWSGTNAIRLAHNSAPRRALR